jgi:hypothetical protein
MKTYTDQFHCSAAQMQASLLNISRNDNCTADSLAKDAYRLATYVHQPCSHSCSFGAHHSKCQLFRALLHVHNPCTLILSALCCWNEMRCLLSKKTDGPRKCAMSWPLELASLALMTESNVLTLVKPWSTWVITSKTESTITNGPFYQVNTAE